MISTFGQVNTVDESESGKLIVPNSTQGQARARTWTLGPLPNAFSGVGPWPQDLLQQVSHRMYDMSGCGPFVRR